MGSNHQPGSTWKYLAVILEEFLVVSSLDYVTILEFPNPFPSRLVVLKVAGEVISVSEYPFSVRKFAFEPFSDKFDFRGIYDVGSLAVFPAMGPVTGKPVFVLVLEKTFTMPVASLEVAYVRPNIPK